MNHGFVMFLWVHAALHFILAIAVIARIIMRRYQVRSYRRRILSGLYHNVGGMEEAERQAAQITTIFGVVAVYAISRAVVSVLAAEVWQDPFTTFSGRMEVELPHILYLIMMIFFALVFQHQISFSFATTLHMRFQAGKVLIVCVWISLFGHLILLCSALYFVVEQGWDSEPWTSALAASLGVTSLLCSFMFLLFGSKLRILLGHYPSDPDVCRTRLKATIVTGMLGVWCAVRGAVLMSVVAGHWSPEWKRVIGDDIGYIVYGFAEFGTLVGAVLALSWGNSSLENLERNNSVQRRSMFERSCSSNTVAVSRSPRSGRGMSPRTEGSSFEEDYATLTTDSLTRDSLAS